VGRDVLIVRKMGLKKTLYQARDQGGVTFFCPEDEPMSESGIDARGSSKANF